MFKSIAYICIIFLFTPVAIAKDRSFIYVGDGKSTLMLLSICDAGTFEHNGEVLYKRIPYEKKKVLYEKGRDLGFSVSGCQPPMRQHYENMGVSLFITGNAVLYLTSDEIEEFKRVNKETGYLKSFNISKTWPPKR